MQQINIELSTQESSGKLTRKVGFKPSFGVVAKGASRDEMNLAEFPLTVLSTRSNPRIKTLEFSDAQRLRTGEVIERSWIITGADKFGLPTSTDDDVILGLIRLTMEQGFRSPKVYFSRYELLKTLRWSTEGRSYSRLTKALDRLSGVRIRATNSFFDNASKSYTTKNFGIIDAYEIKDGRNKEGDTPSFFIWSEVLFESFKSGFIKKLDLDLYFSLKSSVSRRVYRYLDKHFYFRSIIEKPLMPFAFEKIGLSRSYKYVSSIKQQMEPGLDELVEIGFLDSYEFSGRGQDAVIRFVSENVSKTRGQGKTVKGSVGEESSSSENSELEKLKAGLTESLVARGLTLNQCVLLLEGSTGVVCNKIRSIIKFYDYLVSSNDKRVSKNKVGFLYRAIENPEKISLPSSFSNKQGGGSCSSRNSSKRPELRVVTAPSEESPKRELSEKERQRVRQSVELKLHSLKDVLGDKYQAVLEKCLAEELGE